MHTTAKLEKALIRLATKIEKSKSPIEKARLTKSFNAKDKKLRQILGIPEIDEATAKNVAEKLGGKKLEDIPDEAW